MHLELLTDRKTEKIDGGLYSRLGWHPVRQIEPDGKPILIMEVELDRQVPIKEYLPPMGHG